MDSAIKSLNQNADLFETTTGRWSWLYTLSGTAALLAGALFLAAAAGYVASLIAPSTLNGWGWPFSSNWLIVLFELHAGIAGARPNPLQGLNLADLLSLVLVAGTYLGRTQPFRKAVVSGPWSPWPRPFWRPCCSSPHSRPAARALWGPGWSPQQSCCAAKTLGR